MGTKDETLAKAFGELLRAVRQKAGLTQVQLGAKMDPPMQVQALSRYEGGTRVPTLALLYRLATALGCEPCELLPKVK